MKPLPLPSQEYLQECIEYSPNTGLVFWKERPLEHFKTEKAWKIFRSRFANKPAFAGLRPDNYLVGKLDGVSYYTHRVIFKLVHGYDPNIIDHDDGCTFNNRIINLIDGTQCSNMKNQRKASNNTSGITGVSWDTHNEVWVAYLYENHKRIRLGSSVDIQIATAIRKDAEKSHGFSERHGK